jgi:ketosteroid isomerase-like protein
MSAAENTDRIRAGYTAFNSGDVPALVDLFAEDIVWHFPGTSKLAGEHVGRDAALGALGAYGAASNGTLQANLVDLVANGDRVLGWARDTAANATGALDIDSIVIFTLRDGKVTDGQQIVSDPTALDAFLA